MVINAKEKSRVRELRSHQEGLADEVSLGQARKKGAPGRGCVREGRWKKRELVPTPEVRMGLA